MLPRVTLTAVAIAVGIDGMMLMQAQTNPIFSVPSSGLMQWIMLGLLGVIVFMLREYYARHEKFQEQVDQRLRDLQSVAVRHSERLQMRIQGHRPGP